MICCSLFKHPLPPLPCLGPHSGAETRVACHKYYPARGGNLTQNESTFPFVSSPRLVGGACIEHEKETRILRASQRVVLCEIFLRFRWKRPLPQKRQANCRNAFRHYRISLQKREADVNYFRMAQKSVRTAHLPCLAFSYDFGEGSCRANAEKLLIIHLPRGQSDKRGIIS